MSLLKQFEKLEKKADKYYGMHDTECIKMFELIKPMLQFPMPYEGQTVFFANRWICCINTRVRKQKYTC